MSSATLVWVILAGAVVTYLTRIGGHAVLSRFPRIHPRVEAALNAVPAAVLTTLVAPEAARGGVMEIASLAVAAIMAMRFGMMSSFLAGGAVILVARQMGF